MKQLYYLPIRDSFVTVWNYVRRNVFTAWSKRRKDKDSWWGSERRRFSPRALCRTLRVNLDHITSANIAVVHRYNGYRDDDVLHIEL